MIERDDRLSISYICVIRNVRTVHAFIVAIVDSNPAASLLLHCHLSHTSLLRCRYLSKL